MQSSHHPEGSNQPQVNENQVNQQRQQSDLPVNASFSPIHTAFAASSFPGATTAHARPMTSGASVPQPTFLRTQQFSNLSNISSLATQILFNHRQQNNSVKGPANLARSHKGDISYLLSSNVTSTPTQPVLPPQQLSLPWKVKQKYNLSKFLNSIQKNTTEQFYIVFFENDLMNGKVLSALRQTGFNTQLNSHETIQLAHPSFYIQGYRQGTINCIIYSEAAIKPDYHCLLCPALSASKEPIELTGTEELIFIEALKKLYHTDASFKNLLDAIVDNTNNLARFLPNRRSHGVRSSVQEEPKRNDTRMQDRDVTIDNATLNTEDEKKLKTKLLEIYHQIKKYPVFNITPIIEDYQHIKATGKLYIICIPDEHLLNEFWKGTYLYTFKHLELNGSQLAKKTDDGFCIIIEERAFHLLMEKNQNAKKLLTDPQELPETLLEPYRNLILIRTSEKKKFYNSYNMLLEALIEQRNTHPRPDDINNNNNTIPPGFVPRRRWAHRVRYDITPLINKYFSLSLENKNRIILVFIEDMSELDSLVRGAGRKLSEATKQWDNNRGGDKKETAAHHFLRSHKHDDDSISELSFNCIIFVDKAFYDETKKYQCFNNTLPAHVLDPETEIALVRAFEISKAPKQSSLNVKMKTIATNAIKAFDQAIEEQVVPASQQVIAEEGLVQSSDNSRKRKYDSEEGIRATGSGSSQSAHATRGDWAIFFNQSISPKTTPSSLPTPYWTNKRN